MDVFIKAPKTTAERIAGTALGPFLPSLLLVFPPLCLSLLQLSYYILLLSVQLQKRKTPNQLAREFVSQSAGQRALPIIIVFLSCSLSIAQVPQCTCKPIDMFRDLHWLQQLLV